MFFYICFYKCFLYMFFTYVLYVYVPYSHMSVASTKSQFRRQRKTKKTNIHLLSVPIKNKMCQQPDEPTDGQTLS